MLLYFITCFHAFLVMDENTKPEVILAEIQIGFRKR